MPEIEIRPSSTTDLNIFLTMDHSYQTDYVWQMDRVVEDSQTRINFRQIRLPRPVKVEYPYSSNDLVSAWGRQSVLTAWMNGQQVGYVCLEEDRLPATAWIRGLVVSREARRRGIASGLVLAAQEWAEHRNNRRINIEMQSKNYPAICMALKLGYDFCGFQDHYYSNRDIALFFTRFLH